MKVTCPLHVTPCHLAWIYQHFSKMSTYWTATLWLSAHYFPLLYSLASYYHSVSWCYWWQCLPHQSHVGGLVRTSHFTATQFSLSTFSNPFTSPYQLFHMCLLLHQKNTRNNRNLNLDQASSIMEQVLRVLWTVSYGTQTIIYCYHSFLIFSHFT